MSMSSSALYSNSVAVIGDMKSSTIKMIYIVDLVIVLLAAAAAVVLLVVVLPSVLRPQAAVGAPAAAMSCIDNRCLNGASCASLATGSTCICAPGYTDNNCSTDIDECALNATLCPPDKVCINIPGRYGRYLCACSSSSMMADCRSNILNKTQPSILTPGKLEAFSCLVSSSKNYTNTTFVYDQVNHFPASVTTRQSNSSYKLTNADVNGTATYWVHVAADWSAPAAISAYLLDARQMQTFAFQQTYPHSGVETVSRQGLVELPSGPGNGLTMQAGMATLGTGNMQAYWAGFRVDNLFAPFYTTRVFGADDKGMFSFTALYTGTHFMTFGASVVPSGATSSVQLFIDGNKQTLEPEFGLSVMNVTAKIAKVAVFASRSCMLNLLAKNIVALSPRGSVIILYLDAFLYSPKIRNTVVWAVTTSQHETLLKKTSPLLIMFNIITVNTGNAWNRKASYATIPVSGTYYVHLEIGTCSRAVAAINVTLNNAETVIYVQFTDLSVPQSQSRSQGNILDLHKGNKLAVYLTNGCYYSGHLQTAFYGMLLGFVV